MIGRWVAFWDQREAPWRLELVRIALGGVLIVELANLARLGLVVPLFASQADGGLIDHAGSWLDVAGPWTTWVVLLTAAIALCIGVAPRVAAAVLVVVWAAWSMAVPVAGRAADQLVRDALCILVFAPIGRWGALQTRWTTGSWRGDGDVIVAWPRQLLVVQLVFAYFFAGLQKVDASWWPWGDATALFVILQDPAVARVDFGWLRGDAWLLTAFGTVATVAFQLAYPALLVLRRTRLHTVFIAVGVAFHLSLALTMELGLFPWAMLALYPALLRDPRQGEP